MSKRESGKPGYGWLLDAWDPPEEAGQPVGCVATSFTFSPAFFEEECLGRFLHLESDRTEDGAIYLVEREEKLSQVTCAAALVDQNHCRGVRSLRWDMLPARVPGAILHAKVSLLQWANHVRIIIASANLTESGYRKNREIFGVLDYHEGSDAPLDCLREIMGFLRECVAYGGSEPTPAVSRWNGFLDRVLRDSGSWGREEQRYRQGRVHVHPVLTGQGRPSAFARLRELWPGGSPPGRADVVSPFFDPPDAENRPAQEIWKLLRQRGEAAACYYVTAEDIPDGHGVLLHAPESLVQTTPSGREQARAYVSRVPEIIDGEARPLHAKAIWLENDTCNAYMVGSSNFTTPGLGLGSNPNVEANLLYSVYGMDRATRGEWHAAFIPWENIPEDAELHWQGKTERGEDEADGSGSLLPAGFAQAVYESDETMREFVRLSFAASLPAGWELRPDDEEAMFYDEAQWRADGSPLDVKLDWLKNRPPSGFAVTWAGSRGSAWWPVNVLNASSLPPPAELRDLSLDALIHILTSARPVHEVIRSWKTRRCPEIATVGVVITDPHRRVDTSAFLLQRTRRVSWALTALRERLGRPVPTRESLDWRLRGPIGVGALSRAIQREAHGEEEKHFLLAELALELHRVRPVEAPGCLPRAEVRKEIRKVIAELLASIPMDSLGDLPNLKEYVASVFTEILR
jgi:hypothetical protein